MSLQEDRIARLSRMVNCAISSQQLARPGESEAALQYLRALRHTRAAEEERNRKQLSQYLEQETKDQCQVLATTHTRQRNSEILKLQIEAKQQRDAALLKQALEPSVYPAIEGITEEATRQKLAQQRALLQNELAAQIREKAERRRQLKEEEAAEARKQVERARKALSEELQEKTAFKRTVAAQLTQSWEQAIRTHQIKEEIDRLRMMPMAAPSLHKPPRTLSGLRISRNGLRISRDNLRISRDNLRISRNDLRNKLNELTQEEARISLEKAAVLSQIRSASTCQSSPTKVSRSRLPQLSTKSYRLAARETPSLSRRFDLTYCSVPKSLSLNN